ncbi:MAG: hypothetical protein WCK90_02995 [archaeon]
MISYTDLYESLRKEKYSQTLQVLPKSFVSEVAEFLSVKREEVSKDTDLFAEHILKTKKQLENSVSIFRELMRLRKKKLLDLIYTATETGMMKRDYENMLSFEKEVFDVLVRAFEESDGKMTRELLGNARHEENKMIMFKQNVEQFVDMSGNIIGPFNAGALVNLDSGVSQILVSDGRASFVDE